MKKTYKNLNKRNKTHKKYKGGDGEINSLCSSDINASFFSEISDKQVLQLPGLNYDYSFEEECIPYLKQMYNNTLINVSTTFDEDKPYLTPFLTYIRSFRENMSKRNKLTTLLYLFGRELNVNNVYFNHTLEIGKNNFQTICGSIEQQQNQEQPNTNNSTQQVRINCGIKIVLPTIFKKIFGIYSKIPDFSGKFKYYFIMYQDIIADVSLTKEQKRQKIDELLNQEHFEIVKTFNQNLIFLLATLQTSGETILEYINIHFIQQENMKAFDAGLDNVLTYLIGNTYDKPTPGSDKEKVFNYIQQNFGTIDTIFGKQISDNIFESSINIKCNFDNQTHKVSFSVIKKSSFILSIGNGSSYSQPLAIMFLEENFDITNNKYNQVETFRWIIDKSSLTNIVTCSQGTNSYSFLNCVQPNENLIPLANNQMCSTNANISVGQQNQTQQLNQNNRYENVANKAKAYASKAKEVALNNPEAVGVGATMAAVGSALGTLAYYGLIFGGTRSNKHNKKKRRHFYTRKK
uniref:Uncharacterized protein n=1 Tax=viral metagenome TaxID=1070528 RepID=A0A6C0IWD3_9ZZZZ